MVPGTNTPGESCTLSASRMVKAPGRMSPSCMLPFGLAAGIMSATKRSALPLMGGILPGCGEQRWQDITRRETGKRLGAITSKERVQRGYFRRNVDGSAGGGTNEGGRAGPSSVKRSARREFVIVTTRKKI